MKKFKFTYTQMIALGFLILILVGGFLLSLPFSSRTGEFTPLIDSIFTAGSATCVTGLIIFDTYTHWSIYGQLIILTLIQIGGLGFMTIATLFSLFLGRRIGLKERGLIQESVNALNLGGIVRLIRYALLGTFLFEIVGAIVLSIRFVPRMGFVTGVYNGIFHSVSAFCNAGFDLMGRYDPFSSITTMPNDYVVNIVIMILIVIGGIGFLVWEDALTNGLNWRSYRLHSKIVLAATFILIVGGAILFYLIEYRNAFAHLGDGERILAAFFQSVTTRTAGFNSIDLTTLTESSIFISIILMFIGASPGSTGGGIKTTTLVVLFLSTIAAIKKKPELNIYGRRLDDDTLKKACSVIVIYSSVAIMGILAISISQSLPLLPIVFEVISAMSTVGLTLNTTGELTAFSKIIIVTLMYLGRVGSLTVAFVFAAKQENVTILLPKEKITIG